MNEQRTNRNSDLSLRECLQESMQFTDAEDQESLIPFPIDRQYLVLNIMQISMFGSDWSFRIKKSGRQYKILYQSIGPSNDVKISQTVTEAAADCVIHEFKAALKWKEMYEYTDRNVTDADLWSLSINYKDLHFESGGKGVFPDDYDELVSRIKSIVALIKQLQHEHENDFKEPKKQ